MLTLPVEAALQKAADENVIAGLAVAAAIVDKNDPQNIISYAKAFGKNSLQPDAEETTPDTLMWVASLTKLLTTICALQLVESGHLTLHGPISDYLPEYASPIPLVLPSPDPTSTAPIVSSTDVPLTLHHLLTHTSGMGYEHTQPLLAAWRASLPDSSPQSSLHMPQPRLRNIVKEYLMPLTFVPGAPGRWQYGLGIDWAGKAVERANPDGLSLGAYMQEKIFKPLGMISSTFRPLSDAQFRSRLIPRLRRRPDGVLENDPMIVYPHLEPHDEAGGGGIYTTATDYIKVLQSLLLNDGKLLPKSVVEKMFSPQLPESQVLQATLSQLGDTKTAVMDSEQDVTDVRWNQGIGGLLAVDGVKSKAAEGTIFASGLPNCYWFIDQKSGTIGCYLTQLYPPAEEISQKFFSQFQKDLYCLSRV